MINAMKMRLKIKRRSYSYDIIRLAQLMKSSKAHSQVSETFWQLKAFKSDEKCFLFHLKSSSRSLDNYLILVLTFKT